MRANRLGVLFGIGVLIGLPACKKLDKEMDAKRAAFSEAATPCPAPATCTEKRHGDGGRDFKVCANMPADAKYVAGDVVLVHEVALDMIAKVKTTAASNKFADYDVEFADGNTLPRPAKGIVARVCN